MQELNDSKLDMEIFEEKIRVANVGLKEFLSDREQWLKYKVYDELHMQRWLLGILFDGHESGGSRLLDVGAGYGGFAVAASFYGFEVTALEPNPDLAEIIHLRARRFGTDVRVICGTLESLRDEDSPYNVVTMWNVLEHVDSPINVLLGAKRSLIDQGALYLNVMNRFSIKDPHLHLWGVNLLPQPLRLLTGKLLRPTSATSPYKMTFADLHYFTPKGFSQLAQEAGFSAQRLDNEQGKLLSRVRPSFLFRLTSSLVKSKA